MSFLLTKLFYEVEAARVNETQKMPSWNDLLNRTSNDLWCSNLWSRCFRSLRLTICRNGCWAGVVFKKSSALTINMMMMSIECSNTSKPIYPCTYYVLCLLLRRVRECGDGWRTNGAVACCPFGGTSFNIYHDNKRRRRMLKSKTACVKTCRGTFVQKISVYERASLKISNQNSRNFDSRNEVQASFKENECFFEVARYSRCHNFFPQVTAQ